MGMMDKLVVRIPATTANLGPGFDCLGMALDIWNEVHVSTCVDGSVAVHGQGADELPADGNNLVYRAMDHLFGLAGATTSELGLECYNEIPLKRGLGSSSAAIVGGLVAANYVLASSGERRGYPSSRDSELPFSQQQLLEQAVELEGHPDNVTPALLGGLQLVVREGDVLLPAPVPVPEDIRAVLFVPHMTIATEDARAVLPSEVTRQDAVYNMGRAALLVNALATDRLGDLRLATMDRLHQPYRQKLFPAMKVIFSGAMTGGALGVFLSGSGSTILALTKGHEMTVAYEMAEAARQASIEGEVKITRPTSRGAYVVGAQQREPKETGR